MKKSIPADAHVFSVKDALQQNASGRPLTSLVGKGTFSLDVQFVHNYITFCCMMSYTYVYSLMYCMHTHSDVFIFSVLFTSLIWLLNICRSLSLSVVCFRLWWRLWWWWWRFNWIQRSQCFQVWTSSFRDVKVYVVHRRAVLV